MKTKEELNALKDEELEQVNGGVGSSIGVIYKSIVDPEDKQIVTSYNDAEMAKE